jgi:hypothetical protein
MMTRQIYSLLLPHQESYEFAKGTLEIQAVTVSPPESASHCVTAEAATEFKDAIADHDRVNSQLWSLQPRFQIEQPYEMASSESIQKLFKKGLWKSFYERYPNAGGYIIKSAVGFNSGKTRAAVYMGSACGGLCGRWKIHLLEKIDGQWKSVPGVTSITLS